MKNNQENQANKLILENNKNEVNDGEKKQPKINNNKMHKS